MGHLQRMQNLQSAKSVILEKKISNILITTSIFIAQYAEIFFTEIYNMAQFATIVVTQHIPM
jgi:hypothetical protein